MDADRERDGLREFGMLDDGELHGGMRRRGELPDAVGELPVGRDGAAGVQLHAKRE